MISQILYQVLQNFILDGILSSYKVILKEKNNSNHNDNKNYEKKKVRMMEKKKIRLCRVTFCFKIFRTVSDWVKC